MRIINILGFSLGSFSLILSMIVVLTKLFLWNSFAFGLAMLSTSMLFLSGIILFSIGVIGEYIGFINQRSLRLPLVVEERRINVP
jgi:dolichol-phosphate mannosyltransferase